MASRALREWRTTQRAELDRLDALRRRVGGDGAAERGTWQQLVDTAIVLLAAHFQRCCRDLYGEAAWFLAEQVEPRPARTVLRERLMDRLQLARGNASSASLETDFGRLDLQLWRELLAPDPRNGARRHRLDQLIAWRNAIAHQDSDIVKRQAGLLAGSGRDARSVRTWRQDCTTLVNGIDAVVKQQIVNVTGRPPW